MGCETIRLLSLKSNTVQLHVLLLQVQPSQPAEVNNLYYQNTYQTLSYGSSYGIPYTYAAYGSSEAKSQKTDNTVPFKTPSNEMTPITIDLVKKQLKDR